MLNDNTSAETRRNLAEDYDTPAEILEQLSKDSDFSIRALVASNPNTPTEVLTLLDRDFATEITTNPVFSLLMLEDPSSKFVRRCLASSAMTPIELLEKLALDEYVRARVAANLNAPLSLLKQLATASKQNIYVLEALARNPRTSADILDKLILIANRYYELCTVDPLDKQIADRYYELCREVSKHPNTSAQTLEKLANDCDRDVRDKVMKHPNVSAIAIEIVQFMEGKLDSPISSECLVVLAKNNDYIVRQLVANHASTLADTLAELAVDKEADVRRVIASNPNTPIYVLSEFAQDPDSWVCEYVAKNNNSSADILTKLARDSAYHVRQEVATHANTPVWILEKLAAEKNVFVSNEAAKNPNLFVKALKIQDTKNSCN